MFLLFISGVARAMARTTAVAANQSAKGIARIKAPRWLSETAPVLPVQPVSKVARNVDAFIPATATEVASRGRLASAWDRTVSSVRNTTDRATSYAANSGRVIPKAVDVYSRASSSVKSMLRPRVQELSLGLA